MKIPAGMRKCDFEVLNLIINGLPSKPHDVRDTQLFTEIEF